MSRHDPLVSLRHMLDHAREAVQILGNQTVDQLRDNRLAQLALVKCIEIVGEAVSRIPEDIRGQHPQVPWRDAKNMRNQLIHGYDIIRYDIVWQAVTEDFPPLIKQLEAILDEK